MKPSRPELPREFVASHKRRRMMDAVAELTAEQGYDKTKIADIVRRAAVARKTLYDNFDGKEDLFLSALDASISEAVGLVEQACEAAEKGWERQVEAGLGALLAFVAEKPAAARMCLVEAVSATPSAASRYDRAMHDFVVMLNRVAPKDAAAPETIAESLVGGIAWVLQQQIRRDGAPQAADLLPELSQFVLSPYHDVGNVKSIPGGETDSTVADSNT